MFTTHTSNPCGYVAVQQIRWGRATGIGIGGKNLLNAQMILLGILSATWYGST
jgi:hypothetical protein